MASVTQKSKQHIGGGNFEYIFECFCKVPLPLVDITVVAANDNEAKALAQMECEQHCDQQ
jgi:hypothetical protein